MVQLTAKRNFAPVKHLNMRKILLITVLATGLMSNASAQKDGLKFSAGPEIGFATGNLSSTHSLGIGASGQLEFGLQDKLNFTATAGVMNFSGKDRTSTDKFKGFTIIPIRAGVKYFLTTGIYAGAQLGAAFLSGYGDGTAFSYSPQIGYEFKTKNDKSVDATFKYEGWSKNGSWGGLGLRLAYVF